MRDTEPCDNFQPSKNDECIFVPFCVGIFRIQAIILRGRLVSLSITSRDHPFLRGPAWEPFAQNVRGIKRVKGKVVKKRKLAQKGKVEHLLFSVCTFI